MKKTHVICTGCSFTRQWRLIGLDGSDSDFLEDIEEMWRWPHHIKKLYPNFEVYNLGSPSNDNFVILQSTLKKVNDLINEGVDFSQIKILVQWSAQTRKSNFISNEYIINNHYSISNKSDDFLVGKNAFAEKNHYETEYGYYMLSGGIEQNQKPKNDFQYVYVKYQNNDEDLIQILNYQLLLQEFCNNKNIDFFVFNMGQNFIGSHSNIVDFIKGVDDVYLNKKINSLFLNYDNLKNPYIKYLVDFVDFSKIWFFKNNYTDCGGIIEWAISNFDLENDRFLFMEHTPHHDKNIKLSDYNSLVNVVKTIKKINIDAIGHVSNQMNKKFVKEILSKFLEN